MSKSMHKKKEKNSVSRLVFVVLTFILQTAWVIIQLIRLNEHSAVISSITNLVTATVVVYIYIKEDCSDVKISWIILILVFPVMGLGLYLMYGTSRATKTKCVKSERINKEFSSLLEQNPKLITQLQAEDLSIANQAQYISKFGNSPLYQNTDVVYYKDAKDGFEAQLIELENAKEFIFMEYHAIEDAKAFGRLKEVLARKAAEGVEVRIFYDDVGSIGFINPGFIRKMLEQGIQCRIFNRIIPALQIFMQNRDHRKITVIDGKVGFTGGYNLADEYFNIVQPYGYWKDTGIRLEGDAVLSLTIMFLQMWNFIEKTDVSYEKYLMQHSYHAKETGYIQPYAVTPLNKESIAENVYMNMIKNAKKYIYFITPYLILSNEMIRELTLAAKRGVDVRIITPGIPDKELVYRVTRSYYYILLSNGVNIYEFTPGFCHAKQCICDDESAIIGTINLDYRSMFHHFENAVWMYRTSVIEQMKEDFEDTFSKSQPVGEDILQSQSIFTHIGNAFLRLFSTLL